MACISPTFLFLPLRSRSQIARSAPTQPGRTEEASTVGSAAGSLAWRQEEPEEVIIRLPDQPDRVYYRGSVLANDGFLGDVPEDLMAEPTIPPGHPEAFHAAFARLHRCFEQDVRAYQEDKPFRCDGSKYASVMDGRIGIAFIAAAVASSQQGGAWVDV